MVTVNRCYLLLVIVLMSPLFCNGQLVGVERLVQQRKIQQSWPNLEELVPREDSDQAIEFKKQLGGLLQNWKTSSYPTIVSGANVSQQCLEDSLFYVESLLFNRSNWALKSKLKDHFFSLKKLLINHTITNTPPRLCLLGIAVYRSSHVNNLQFSALCFKQTSNVQYILSQC